MKLKRPKIRKTAKNRYSAQFYIRKYRENAHFHGNGFKSMFLPIKILEPRFFWSLRHTSNQKTSKEKWAPPKIFLDKHMYVRDFYKFTWMRPYIRILHFGLRLSILIKIGAFRLILFLEYSYFWHYNRQNL